VSRKELGDSACLGYAFASGAARSPTREKTTPNSYGHVRELIREGHTLTMSIRLICGADDIIAWLPFLIALRLPPMV
jgi:hypothetical protein